MSSCSLQPWLRRLITRGFAILPATVVILMYGSEGTGQLLILSQVVLSFQLPFAIVPLVMFTASRAKMGPMVSPAMADRPMRPDRRHHHRTERESADRQYWPDHGVTNA